MPLYKELAIARLTFTQMVEMLLHFAEENSIHIVPASCWRSRAEQKRLFDMKASKTLDSRHCYALAIDFVLFDNLLDYKETLSSRDARWAQLGKYWKHLGGVWGGDWGWDAGHFEFWPFEKEN